MYEKAIAEIFSTKRENLKFKVADIHLHSDEDDSELANYFLTCNENWREFNFYSEVIDKLSDNKPTYRKGSTVPYYRVAQFIQQANGALKPQISYKMTWINGTLSVVDFTMGNEYLKNLGVREAVDFRKREPLKNIPLPFSDNEAQILTPMMKSPIYGKVVKALDEFEEYVYLFYPSDDKFKECPPLDLSHQKIDMTSDFNTYDCVSYYKSSSD